MVAQWTGGDVVRCVWRATRIAARHATRFMAARCGSWHGVQRGAVWAWRGAVHGAMRFGEWSDVVP